MHLREAAWGLKLVSWEACHDYWGTLGSKAKSSTKEDKEAAPGKSKGKGKAPSQTKSKRKAVESST